MTKSQYDADCGDRLASCLQTGKCQERFNILPSPHPPTHAYLFLFLCLRCHYKDNDTYCLVQIVVLVHKCCDRRTVPRWPECHTQHHSRAPTFVGCWATAGVGYVLSCFGKATMSARVRKHTHTCLNTHPVNMLSKT